MSTEPDGQGAPPEAQSEPQTLPLLRGRRPAAALAAAAFALLAVIAAGALLLRRQANAAAPLPAPASRALVVLLAPGASLDDWRDSAVAPALAAFAEGGGVSSGAPPGFLGLVPARREGIPWRAEIAGSLWTPVTEPDLRRSAAALGGPALGGALRAAGARAVALGGDPAARAFLGLPPAGAGAAFETGPAAGEPASWQTRRADAVDGAVTDPERFARAIRRAAVPPAGGTTGTAVVVAATYDDLFRDDAYAPLAVPAATAARRREALARLDALVAHLTGSGDPAALPAGTALLVVTPLASPSAATRGDLLGPVLYWPGPAAAASPAAALLTSPSTRAAPGLIAPPDIAATVAALVGAGPVAGSDGRPMAATATLRRDALACRVASWAAQLRARRLLTGLPFVLALLLIAGALRRPPAPRRRAAPLVPAIGLLTAGGMALLVVADSVTGGGALAASPLSWAPALGARGAGAGSELSGVLLGASLLGLVFAGESLTAVLLGGLAVALVLGLPGLGADAGGFAAALFALGVWAARRLVAGGRPRLPVVLGVTAVALAVLTLFVLGSALLPEGLRTHVGPAVAGAALLRKDETALRLLVASPWSALLAVEAGVIAWLWRRRSLPASPDGDAVAAACAGAAALLLLNDSGSAAAAACLLYPAARLICAPRMTPSSALAP